MNWRLIVLSTLLAFGTYVGAVQEGEKDTGFGECSICYENLSPEQGQDVITLACNRQVFHPFHAVCLNKWNMRNQWPSRDVGCPLCRFPLMQELPPPPVKKLSESMQVFSATDLESGPTRLYALVEPRQNDLCGIMSFVTFVCSFLGCGY